ncbi:spore germination protein (amino acid permease) [Bacillus horti]|uniref:Spore germination protein (Amino acid permease) n=2 Tax=Caldalkalibacillus horti TaxID=77523 RepID=A0ABT9VUQ0_9BACI|nr:spore germination protein (amino acid permease) [Bacillus horti]
MNTSPSSITRWQFTFLILQTQIGIGILFLPYTVQKYAGGSAWISVLVSGGIVQLLLLLFYFLCVRYPRFTLVEIMKVVLGKYIGGALGAIYSIYFLCIGGSVLLVFTNIINTWFYPNTPSWVIIGIMILLAAYLVREELRIIARFHVLTSSLLIIVILLMIWSYTGANLLYALPLNQAGIKDILLGAQEVTLSVLGFEMMLYAFPYVEGSNKKKLQAVTLANIAVTLIYTFLVFTSIVAFSPREIELVPQPTLYLLKALSTRIVERIDLLFMAIWVVFVATTFMSYLYLSSKGISQLGKKIKFKSVVTWIGLLIFLLTIWPQNLLNIIRIDILLGKASIYFILVIPCLVLLLTFLRKRKKGGGL